MPTRSDTNFARPLNKDEFERLICDLCRLEWKDPNTDLRGRSGQKQFGVDVYGQPDGQKGAYRGVQCKLRTQNTQLSRDEIEKEVNDAKQFPHRLDMLIIATDAPRDTQTQDLVNSINEREQQLGGFKVGMWFWEAISQRIAAYPSVIIHHYSDYFANLTSLPLVEKLVDTPLQILSFGTSERQQLSSLEEALRLRGIHIRRPEEIKQGWIDVDHLDGILFQYELSRPTQLLRFSSLISAYRNTDHPVLVVISEDLRGVFFSHLESLDVNPAFIEILTSERPLNSLAEEIFISAFGYGYQRRGSLSTIDLAIRCSPTSQRGTFLDIDWESRLSTHHFPSPDEWESVLYPALVDILRVISEQGDKTRLQIRPILPLPAALAWGYAFNLRVARIGVWARDVGQSDFKQQFWLSDGEPTSIMIPRNWITAPGSNPRRAIVEMTTGPDIHTSVIGFLTDHPIDYDTWLQIGIGLDANRTQNIDEGLAVAYSNEVGKIFRNLNQKGISEIHLFIRMPSALSVLVGQRLQACGRIHLYWFDNPTYKYAFTLR